MTPPLPASARPKWDVGTGGGGPPRATAVSLLIAVSASRLICGLVVVKALSALLGPARFGTLAQVAGIASGFYTFAGGSVTNGIMIHAGGDGNSDERNRWLAAALTIGAFSSVVLALVALGLYGVGARALLGDEALAPVFLGIAAAQAVMGLGNILLARASAVGDLRLFASASIAGTLAAAAVTVAATLTWGFAGAVWASILAPTLPAIAIIAMQPRPLAAALHLILPPDRARLAILLRAGAMLAIAIPAVSTAQAYVRADLAATVGWHSVGLWQAIARLSDAYMQVFGVLVINLLFPRLIAHATTSARNSEIVTTGAAMLGLFILGGAVLLVLRGPVVAFAYSAEFLPATGFVAPQLAGDFAKVAAWILVYRAMADGRLWVQPAAEIMQAAAFVGFYLLLRPWHGAFAPVFAHVASCAVLLAALAILTWRGRE